jgi:hypothetical protein
VVRTLSGATVGQPLLTSAMTTNLPGVLDRVRYTVRVIPCNQVEPVVIKACLTVFANASTAINDAVQTFFALWPGFQVAASSSLAVTHDPINLNMKPAAVANDSLPPTVATSTASLMVTKDTKKMNPATVASDPDTLNASLITPHVNRSAPAAATSQSIASGKAKAPGTMSHLKMDPTASAKISSIFEASGTASPIPYISAEPSSMATDASTSSVSPLLEDLDVKPPAVVFNRPDPTTSSAITPAAYNSAVASPSQVLGSVECMIDKSPECGTIANDEEVRLHMLEAPYVSLTAVEVNLST